MKYVWRIALSLVVLTLVLASGKVLAQDGTVTQDEVNEVARGLFCPTCESTPLDVCPTQTCQDWRELIRQQLEEGKSKEEIWAYFETNFGPQVLEEPSQKGFNLAVWWVPVLLIAAGGIFFSLYLYQLKKAGTAAAVSSPTSVTPTSVPTAMDPYREQIERELQNKG
ncbi:MAG: cytochrome c-type biogenesis protein CcmH [Chloroflexi bacterium]|nr:cytochrome c-type biogenesis protein CcmH [Chloroflexota bacterium]MBP8058292.1 cytochrome c-type biogenesis protein CcmH [Chloroflexota bacterium]